MDSIEIVRAEGLALGPEHHAAAIKTALASVASEATRFAIRAAE
jgi:hypothetical protein